MAIQIALPCPASDNTRPRRGDLAAYNLGDRMETGMLEANKTDEEPPNNGNIAVAISEPDRRNTIARALSASISINRAYLVS